MIEVIKLGVAEQSETTRAVGWQGVNPLTGDGAFEDYGVMDVMQALGLSAGVWPPDENGYAEGLMFPGAAGRTGIIGGARDTRTAKALGTIRPGDTILHSTGPQQAAQVQCKESKRQVVCYTKDSEGTGMVVMLDGTNDKYQVLCRGGMIEIAPNGDISLIGGGGASILLQGNHIFLNGNVHLAGMPPGMVLMAGPASGSPGGPASVPLFPVLGVGK
jgi:hypothetical protein